MSEKVSIIMPVYNGEAFLRDSIGSVFCQTYRNIELIAIDDGSLDASMQILRELENVAPQGVSVRVMHQENHGICYTRNRALDDASGTYVMFMDQDDSLKKRYVERMVRGIEKEQADLLIGGYELVSEKKKVLKKVHLNPVLPWSLYQISAPWGRIFRRTVIEQGHVRFLITKISEDFYFNMVFMSCCDRIAVTDYAGYGWTFRKMSESHAHMSRASDDRNVLDMLSAVLRDMKQPNRLDCDLIEYMMVKHIVWYLLYTAKSMDRTALRRHYTECMQWLERRFPDYRKNPYLGFFTPKGEAVPVRLIVYGAVRLSRWNLFYLLLRLYSRVGGIVR